MPFNPQKHHRRSIRLKEYDYTQPGAYFVTCCTKERQCLFGDVLKGKMRLNSLGYIAFTSWQPNHLHGILVITDNIIRARQCRAPTVKQNPIPKTEQFGKPVPGYIPTVIRSYKSAVTKHINFICNTKGTSLIWQRDFYEHISRDQESLHKIRKYILENPDRWADDPENPQHHPDNQELLIDPPF